MTRSEEPLPSIQHRPDLLRAGWSDGELRRRRRSGELITIRDGTYAAAAAVTELDPAARHRLTAAAAAARCPAFALSHVSAAAFWELPLWGVDLRRVHFVREGRSGGRVTPTRHDHSATLTADDLATHRGVLVTSVARTLVDLARTESAEATLVAADHALRLGMLTVAELAGALARAVRLPHCAQARRVLGAADGRSESPGESRTRYHLADQLSLDCQVEVRDEHGRFVARVDFGVESAMVLVEFDGRVKYGSHLAPGQSPQDALFAEKRREDALRALGYLVVRVTWADLENPVALLRRLHEAVARGTRLRAAGHSPLGSYRPAPRVGLPA